MLPTYLLFASVPTPARFWNRMPNGLRQRRVAGVLLSSIYVEDGLFDLPLHDCIKVER